MAETLVISCMDRRLNAFLDRLNDGKHIFLRNAGAAVPMIEQSIRYIFDNANIGEALLIAHTDCGAMGYVYSAIKEGKNGLHPDLVKQFSNENFSTRQELEKLNEQIQKKELERIFQGKVKIGSQLIALNEPSDNGEEHALVITKASDEKYESVAKELGLKPENCYFLQANSVAEVMPDIAVATERLGIKDIRLVALESSQYRQVQQDYEALRLRGIGNKARLSMIRI